MISTLSRLFILLCFITSLNSCSRDTQSETQVKFDFPKEISFEYTGQKFDLDATGFTTKNSDYLNYEIASYLQKGTYKSDADKIQTLLNSNYAKQITLKWTEYANAYNVQEGYNKFFKDNLTIQEFQKQRDLLIKFVHFFNENIEKGDMHVLRWLPGGQLEVLINDEKMGSIKDENFTKTLLTVWFGDHAVVNRKKLTSFMK